MALADDDGAPKRLEFLQNFLSFERKMASLQCEYALRKQRNCTQLEGCCNREIKMRMEEERKGIECLPDEILFDIFSRLPLISVLRTMCTCKRWQKLMAEPELTEMHFIRASMSPGYLYLFSHDCNLYYAENSSPLFVYREMGHSSFQYSGHASSGGLMACYAPQEKCYYIYNPFIQERAKVPFSPLHAIDSFWGFGYSPSTKEYKIVQFGRRCSLETLGVGIYTLGSESGWRQIPKCFSLPPTDWQVDCDGTLFWLIRTRVDSGGPENVMSFDVGSEKLQAWRGPTLEVTSTPKSEVPYLVKFDDSVAYVTDDCHCISIWILRDTVRDIWINEYKIVFQSPLRGLTLKFLGIWTNQLLFVAEKIYGKSFSVYYDAEMEEFKLIDMPFRNNFEKPLARFISHVGSLISPLRIMSHGKKIIAS